MENKQVAVQAMSDPATVIAIVCTITSILSLFISWCATDEVRRLRKLHDVLFDDFWEQWGYQVRVNEHVLNLYNALRDFSESKTKPPSKRPN